MARVDEFAPLTGEQLDAALNVGIVMVEKYGDGLVKVMFGLAEPEDAIAAAEESTKKSLDRSRGF